VFVSERILQILKFVQVKEIVHLQTIVNVLQDTLEMNANTPFVMEETVQIQMFVPDVEIVQFQKFAIAPMVTLEMIVN
jgi:hypothetical protein